MYCILTGLDRIKPENEVFEISAFIKQDFWNNATFKLNLIGEIYIIVGKTGVFLTQPGNLLKLQVRKLILINTTSCNLYYYKSESRLVETLQMYELETTYI